MTAEERPTKKEAFLAFLKEGWVSLHLDARRPGVVVPAHLGKEPHLVLQYGQDMPIPIQDLEINDQGVGATLSFAQTPCETQIPWSAVYVIACTDGRGVLYYEDVPEEVALVNPAVSGTTGKPLAVVEGDEGPSEAPAAARRLRAVPAENESAAAPPDDEQDPDSPGKRRKKPQLRLVK